MIVSTRGSVLRLLWWQWRNVLSFTLAGLVAVALYAWLKPLGLWLSPPTLALTVVGAALGIFVSFRTNSAYDRWWEGRKLWGRLINTSRHICSQFTTYIGDDASRRRLVLRHVTYVHALRTLLRVQDPFSDERLLNSNVDAIDELRTETNLTHGLLHRQLSEVLAAQKSGQINEFELQSFDLSLRHLLDIQGGCERIKKTPLPRGYGFIASRLIFAFGLIMPLALVEKIGWLAVPVNVLVTLSFALISEAGRVLEDPFSLFYNGLPLNALSVTIERDLRTRLGDEPPAPVEANNGILM